MRWSGLFLCAAFSSTAALAAERFPFTPSWERIDLAEPDGGEKLKALVERAADETFVHVDWSLHNFWNHEWFKKLDAGASFDPAQKACDAIESSPSAEHFFSGRPDPNDNHLVATIRLRLNPDDPFTTVGCEYFGGDPYALRIRGFFVVRDIGVATANGYEMLSVKVDPVAVPKRFFKP